MADVATHLVDELLPLPCALRKGAGCMRAFCTEIVEAFFCVTDDGVAAARSIKREQHGASSRSVLTFG